jgi:hypothetical protein
MDCRGPWPRNDGMVYGWLFTVCSTVKAPPMIKVVGGTPNPYCHGQDLDVG